MSRNYTPAQKAEIQKRLTELVRTHGRMTFGELRKITGLTIFTARHYLEKAEGVVSSYDRTRNVICTECRNSVTMQRVLAFYRGNYRDAKSS